MNCERQGFKWFCTFDRETGRRTVPCLSVDYKVDFDNFLIKIKELFCKIPWCGNIYIGLATEVLDMPEISLFYGIRVTMYYEDHNPPHFHAEYNGNQRWTSIKSNQFFGLI